jgi:hypothetical protein
VSTQQWVSQCMFVAREVVRAGGNRKDFDRQIGLYGRAAPTLLRAELLAEIPPNVSPEGRKERLRALRRTTRMIFAAVHDQNEALLEQVLAGLPAQDPRAANSEAFTLNTRRLDLAAGGEEMTQITFEEMCAERAEKNRNPVDRLIATLNRMRAFVAAPPTDATRYREQVAIFVTELEKAKRGIGIRHSSIWDLLCMLPDEDEEWDVEEMASLVEEVQGWVDEMEETVQEAAEEIAKRGLRGAVYRGTLDELGQLIRVFAD